VLLLVLHSLLSFRVLIMRLWLEVALWYGASTTPMIIGVPVRWRINNAPGVPATTSLPERLIVFRHRRH
jgi:hypothetical protein